MAEFAIAVLVLGYATGRMHEYVRRGGTHELLGTVRAMRFGAARRQP